MMKKFIQFIYILLFLLLAIACQESDKFSSDPNLKLTYSKDELNFDTVFTAVPSPVQRFKIYNKNNNSITFNSIKLVNAEKSGFRINVDGLAGTDFHDIDLLRKDSLYIMVDIIANKPTSNQRNAEDAIELSWNGNKEYIKLKTFVEDVDILENKTISSNTTLTANKGYYIKGKVTVAENTTLTIEEGTNLYFDQKGSLNIEGSIIAEGSSQKRITFRGHRFDLIERDIPYDNASGQWEGIFIGANSFENIFKNVNIRNSQIGINFATSASTNQKKATLINSIIHNTSQYGLKAINCNIDAINCQFTNSTGGLLVLTGGNYSFLHCTIANYYRWHPRTTSDIVLTDMIEQTKYPFTQCNFTNCIIVGTFHDELDLFLTQTNSQLLFDNCVIQSSRPLTDQWFKNTIWNIDSAFIFKDLDLDKKFFYSFELIEDSSARNAANKVASLKASTDLRGISRFADSRPDIGCYEWYPDE